MKTLLIVTMAAILGGCAFGQSYDYSGASMTIPGAAATTSVTLAVQDRRPYVVSGGKPEKFVGLVRGGFGNPFDANTQSGGPLAIEMRDALARSLKDKGFTVHTVAISPSEAQINVRQKLLAAGGKRIALITLTEWKSDMMFSAALIYDVTLVILDEKGQQLAANSIKGNDKLGTGGGATVMAAVPRKIELLFDDEKIAAALRN